MLVSDVSLKIESSTWDCSSLALYNSGREYIAYFAPLSSDTTGAAAKDFVVTNPVSTSSNPQFAQTKKAFSFFFFLLGDLLLLSVICFVFLLLFEHLTFGKWQLLRLTMVHVQAAATSY